VPNLKPYQNQATINSFLQGYINIKTQKVVLSSNQAIYLFELGTTDQRSSAWDMQDLVVLVSLLPAGSGGSGQSGGGSSGPQVIRKDINLLANNTLSAVTTSPVGTYYTVTITGAKATKEYFTLTSYGKDGKIGGFKENKDIVWVSNKYPNFQ
jgi:hypothetical protein